jgi:hypothetical protein
MVAAAGLVERREAFSGSKWYNQINLDTTPSSEGSGDGGSVI